MHLLANKYGWNIEYILDLTPKQVKLLMDGEYELAVLQNKDKMNDPKHSITGQSKKSDSIWDILSIPGIKATPKAKSVLEALRLKNIKDK